MLDKMQQLMEMKKQADQIKRDLDVLTVDVNEVSGINIVITGSQNFRSVEIDPSKLGAENKAALERDLLQSVNAAVKRSQEVAAQKMKTIMPDIPGLS